MVQTIYKGMGLLEVLPDLAAVEERLKREASSPVGLMQRQAQYILLGRGKRLRPLLILLAASFYRADREAVLDAAVAVELIHTASLVHDDVIDEAGRRRGKKSLNSCWGNHMAVLVGDFLFARAFRILSKYAHLGLLEKMTDVIGTMCEGELEQADSAFDLEKTEEDYLEQIYKKTGCLLRACCEIGAKLSAMPEGEIELLKEYGLQLGYAFQIVDDIADYISKPDEIGKPVGLDLSRGIITLPLLYILGDDKYGALLKRMLSVAEDRRLSSAALDKVRQMVEEGGGVEYALACAQRRVEEAKKTLAAFADCEEKRLLIKIADSVVERISKP
ncbi:MAG: polyprenyl synthetase family protein [Firmicutes bacterium]|jgi:heptaprenyl diphosphate synthase|nr:polyprenyl synthetase family protein [Bacillota bacterium]